LKIIGDKKDTKFIQNYNIPFILKKKKKKKKEFILLIKNPKILEIFY